MRADAAHDVIVDFDLRVHQLNFAALVDGARLGHGDETLTLKTAAGQILQQADLKSIDVQFASHFDVELA